MLVDFDVRGQQVIDFLTGGSIIMDYGFSIVFWPKAQNLDDVFVCMYLMYWSHKM